MTLSGLILWIAGLKIARLSVALLLGGALAALAALTLPSIGLAPISSALLGFAGGALIGAVGFRLLQGLVLGICVGIGIGLLYYAHLPKPVAPTTAQSLQISLDDLPATATADSQPDPAKLARSLASFIQNQYDALASTERRNLLILSLAGGIITTLIAIAFPRHTTWIVTAYIGAFLLLAGLEILRRSYAPRNILLPESTTGRLIELFIVGTLGLLIQRYFFWPKPRKSGPSAPASHPITAVAATPVVPPPSQKP